ncbi:MAG: TlpA family protein disulfide reductase [Pseudomonadota bacterium]
MAQFSRYAIPAMLLGLVFALVYVAFSAMGTGDKSNPLAGFAVDELSKLDFTFRGDVHEETAFFDPDGNEVGLEDFRGKVVLLNLWATWCAPCEKELPSLGALAGGRAGDDFIVLTVSVDDEQDRDYARRRLSELTGGTVDFYHAPDYKVTYQVGARGFPTSVIYDRNGREVARLAGEAEWDSSLAVQFIDRLIALTADS